MTCSRVVALGGPSSVHAAHALSHFEQLATVSHGRGACDARAELYPSSAMDLSFFAMQRCSSGQEQSMRHCEDFPLKENRAV